MEPFLVVGLILVGLILAFVGVRKVGMTETGANREFLDTPDSTHGTQGGMYWRQ